MCKENSLTMIIHNCGLVLELYTVLGVSEA
jgi:hypothetical protein